jgi:lipopolysaccharide/colanic/teichoic acid biosynthesis glycosyltransferase
VLLAVAALVWLDSPGPVFFVQRRYGSISSRSAS